MDIEISNSDRSQLSIWKCWCTWHRDFGKRGYCSGDQTFRSPKQLLVKPFQSRLRRNGTGTARQIGIAIQVSSNEWFQWLMQLAWTCRGIARRAPRALTMDRFSQRNKEICRNLFCHSMTRTLDILPPKNLKKNENMARFSEYFHSFFECLVSSFPIIIRLLSSVSSRIDFLFSYHQILANRKWKIFEMTLISCSDRLSCNNMSLCTTAFSSLEFSSVILDILNNDWI
jgi:hypothetical protein